MKKRKEKRGKNPRERCIFFLWNLYSISDVKKKPFSPILFHYRRRWMYDPWSLFSNLCQYRRQFQVRMYCRILKGPTWSYTLQVNGLRLAFAKYANPKTTIFRKSYAQCFAKNEIALCRNRISLLLSPLFCDLRNFQRISLETAFYFQNGFPLYIHCILFPATGNFLLLCYSQVATDFYPWKLICEKKKLLRNFTKKCNLGR